jgi:hypothetical protein
VGTKWVPPHRGPLLLDAEVRPVDGHEAVVAHVVGTQPAFEIDLAGGAGGGVSRRWPKGHNNKPHLQLRPPARRCAL